VGRLVGLTGNIGSGKSTVGKLLKKRGFTVLDADGLIHELYETRLKDELKRLFGPWVFKEGRLDRKALARVVFNDEEKLRALERLAHSALYEEVERRLKELPPDEPLVLEAALIFEKGSRDRYEAVVTVYAPFVLCKERALKRGMSEEEFLKRWRLQLPPEDKARMADFIVFNDEGPEKLEREVDRLASFLKGDL